MAKKRILVVDDERPLAQFVKKALEQTGNYEVCAETDSRQALAVAKAFKPDLVFMDVAMPHMDGGDVAAQFKEDADLKQVPVIFLTGAVSRDEAGGQGGMIGGRPFIAKPVRIQQLVDAIERYLPTQK